MGYHSSDANAVMVETCANLPFGDLQQCSGSDPSPNHFTGKQRDTETNLDDFGARYFSSQYGRWMSPDWSANPVPIPYANMGNPQSLNLYAYVNNDPITGEDADGHERFDNSPVGGGWQPHFYYTGVSSKTIDDAEGPDFSQAEAPESTKQSGVPIYFSQNGKLIRIVIPNGTRLLLITNVKSLHFGKNGPLELFVTYQFALAWQNGIKEQGGPMEIKMIEAALSGNIPSTCTPCTNKDARDGSYENGRFTDDISVRFGTPFTAKQQYYIGNSKSPSLIVAKQSLGYYAGGRAIHVNATAESIERRLDP